MNQQIENVIGIVGCYRVYWTRENGIITVYRQNMATPRLQRDRIGSCLSPDRAWGIGLDMIGELKNRVVTRENKVKGKTKITQGKAATRSIRQIKDEYFRIFKELNGNHHYYSRWSRFNSWILMGGWIVIVVDWLKERLGSGE